LFPGWPGYSQEFIITSM